MVTTLTPWNDSEPREVRRFEGPPRGWPSDSNVVVPPRPDRASLVPGVPSDIKDRLQINSRTGICQDYLNQFIYLGLYCPSVADQLPGAPNEQFERALSNIMKLTSYQEHLQKRLRPDELTAVSLDTVSALGTKRVRKLNETVEALQAFVNADTVGSVDEQTLKVKIFQVVNRIGVLILGAECWKRHPGRPRVSSTGRFP